MKLLVALELIILSSCASTNITPNFKPIKEKCVYSAQQITANTAIEYYICDTNEDGTVDFIYTNPEIGRCKQKSHYRNLDNGECAIPEKAWDLAQRRYDSQFGKQPEN